MPIRYRIGVALTSLLLLSPSPAQAVRGCRPADHSLQAPGDLYSQRSLRRARRILEFHLLELRKARLERVRSAILRRLPPQTFLGGDTDDAVKHSVDSRIICTQ